MVEGRPTWRKLPSAAKKVGLHKRPQDYASLSELLTEQFSQAPPKLQKTANVGYANLKRRRD